MIFVMGCGRTGTHWIARSISLAFDVELIGEESLLFEMSVSAALRPAQRSRLLESMLAVYRTKPEFCVGKCHPSLWFAPELFVKLPGSRFVLTRRCLLGTVQSMLNHPGTLRWVREQRLYDESCEDGFLGRVAGLDLTGRSLAAGCAARVITHWRRVQELATGLPGAAIFDFDQAAAEPKTTADNLREMLALPRRFELQPLRQTRHPALTGREIQDIQWVANSVNFSLGRHVP